MVLTAREDAAVMMAGVAGYSLIVPALPSQQKGRGSRPPRMGSPRLR